MWQWQDDYYYYYWQAGRQAITNGLGSASAGRPEQSLPASRFSLQVRWRWGKS